MITADTLGILLLIFMVCFGVAAGGGVVFFPLFAKSNQDAAYWRGRFESHSQSRGELNINAHGDANIGGDVTGRDKINQSTRVQ